MKYRSYLLFSTLLFFLPFFLKKTHTIYLQFSSSFRVDNSELEREGQRAEIAALLEGARMIMSQVTHLHSIFSRRKGVLFC